MSSFVHIGEVAEINPRIPRTLTQDTARPVSFVPMSVVSEDGFLMEALEKPLGEVLRGYTYFERGDILLAKITPCMENGKAAHVTDLPHPFGFGSTEFHVLRPGPKVDGRYLFYMIWNPKFRFAAENKMSGAAGQQRVPTDFLKTYQIPLPLLDEQRRIAAILDKADAIRRKRQESIRLTEKFLRSTFLEMFGDPVTNPKGWEVQPLENLVNFTTGKLDSNAAVIGGAYPFFTCAREDFQIDNYAFDCEALLLAGNNASADYSVKYYKGKFNAYQRTYVITMARPDLTYRYMQYALEMKLQDMKRLSKGSNTKYLTLGILNQLQFQVPPMDLQFKFETIKNELTNHLVKHEKALELSNSVFVACTHRAFRGELS